jgi:hypothetical protein
MSINESFASRDTECVVWLDHSAYQNASQVFRVMDNATPSKPRQFGAVAIQVSRGCDSC